MADFDRFLNKVLQPVPPKLGYAELYCKSNFSFLTGASHPEELVRRAHVLGYQALAITDECSVAGVVRAHVAAREVNLKLVIGSEFLLEEGIRLVLLATSRESYADLSGLITRARRAAAKGHYQLRWLDLAEARPKVLALYVPDASTHSRQLQNALDLFAGDCWLSLTQTGAGDDVLRLKELTALARSVGMRTVATGAVLQHVRARKRVQDVLTSIRLGEPLHALGTRLEPNSERHLRRLEQLAIAFPPESLAETVAIAARCTFSLDELRYEYPQELIPAGCTPASHLRELTYAGLAARRAKGSLNRQLQAMRDPAGQPSIEHHVERELALISELHYEPFFLTVYDIVNYARSLGILCQGRGSAANSAVCYCLGITEIDPGRMQVLFERFISRERGEPPDIDVDFEHERREEVIQYIYRKYGRHRTALTATLITYRGRSALRDVGKALGLSLAQVEALSKTVHWWDDMEDLGTRLETVGLDPENPTLVLTIELAREMIGFPRHLSQHVGGFVIARDELSRLVPIENAAMPERTVIQWDKDDLDTLGLLKVDVLALGMLTAIRKTLTVLNDFHGTQWGVDDVPPEDKATYDMLCKADTVGVFQVESRAQMSMLPRLQPRAFYDLVIEVAIVRPGPIQGGMVHPYLRRREGSESVTYPSDAVKSVLVRTLGVPIFQEQAMQLAIVAAGFTPGEADQLRRAMAAWKRRGGLEPFRERLIAGMLARGYEPDYAERIYQQIQGFGEYGFPESHAASFALLVYVSAWLKCHHAAAFACGLLNSQPLGFYSPSQILQDVARHAVAIRAVDVTISLWDSILEATHANSSAHPAIRLGLARVKGLRETTAERLLAARNQRPFESLQSMAERALLDAGDLAALASADALQSLTGHRRQAYWQALGVRRPLGLVSVPKESVQPALASASEGEEVAQDYASMGHTLRSHPLRLLRHTLNQRRIVRATDLEAMPQGRLVRISGLVTCRQRPGTAKGVMFVTLEDETGNANVIVWSRLVERERTPLLTAQLMTVYGQVERTSAVIHVVARRIIDDTVLLNGLVLPSRDFH
jgi:error-prone DNA polymerase